MPATSSAETIEQLLRQTKIEVAPATYAIVGLRDQDWNYLLQSPELSPRSDSPFMIFRDQREVTLVIEEADWQRIRHEVRDAKVEHNYRLVTLDIELPWNTVGYLARVSELLAAAGISLGALSSFSRDHLLIKQDDLAKALRVLGEHAADSC
jgi:uncharacterized protein